MKEFESNGLSVDERDEIYTVTEITEAIRQSLESEFPSVKIIGEIANFKVHTSGHIYFSLRDEHNLLRVVLFRRYASNLRFGPEDGMLVVADGRISHYGGGGQTQLLAYEMVPAGRGGMELEFRRLLQKLMGEGLTSPEKKRPIPAFPERIAVITSPTGAVIRDILDTLARRWPVAEVIHIHAEVQGPAAADSIADALERANGLEGVDVVILARGGGSLEDLWTFNAEKVARAVAGSVHPVISGVGHEIDTTVVDYVSDLRAATPTAAAELASPVIDEVRRTVSEYERKMKDLCTRSSLDRIHMLNYLLRSSAFPALLHRLEQAELRLGERSGRIHGWWEFTKSEALSCVDTSTARLRTALERSIRRCDSILTGKLERLFLKYPEKGISACGERLYRLLGLLRIRTVSALDGGGRDLEVRMRALGGLHPMSVLARGYTYCTTPDGEKVIDSARKIQKGDAMAVNFRDGGSICRVEGKRKGRSWPKR
jgi:exodeoxyribonuclease VII large subunit